MISLLLSGLGLLDGYASLRFIWAWGLHSDAWAAGQMGCPTIYLTTSSVPGPAMTRNPSRSQQCWPEVDAFFHCIPEQPLGVICTRYSTLICKEQTNYSSSQEPGRIPTPLCSRESLSHTVLLPGHGLRPPQARHAGSGAQSNHLRRRRRAGAAPAQLQKGPTTTALICPPPSQDQIRRCLLHRNHPPGRGARLVVPTT